MDTNIQESQALSIIELAEDLGVTPAIIRSWQSNLNLDVPKNGKEEWIYDKKWQDVFKQIAVLRKVGSSFSKIGTQIKNVVQEQNELNPQTEEPAATSSVIKQAETEIKMVKSFLPPTIQSDSNVKVVRSSLSDTELLGMYGPNTKETKETQHSTFATLPAMPLQPSVSQDKARPPSSPSKNLTAFESMIEERKKQPVIQWTQEKVSKELQTIDAGMSEAIAAQDVNRMLGTYTRLVESFQALSSRYSEATFKIGQLREQNTQLNEEVKGLKKEEETKIDQLKAHIGSLKKMLEGQEERLDQQAEELKKPFITLDEIESVKKQIKLLTFAVLEQEENKKQQGFFAKLKAFFSP